jgi:hypothetical protein
LLNEQMCDSLSITDESLKAGAGDDLKHGSVCEVGGVSLAPLRVLLPRSGGCAYFVCHLDFWHKGIDRGEGIPPFKYIKLPH